MAGFFNTAGSAYRFLRATYDLYHWWIFRYVLVPLWLVLPPVLFANLYPNLLWSSVAASLWTILWMAVAKAVAYCIDNREFTLGWLMRMTEALEHVAGYKEERLAAHVQNVSELTRENVFAKVPQPADQILLLVRGVCEFLVATQTGERTIAMRVFLARVKDGQLVGVPVRYPKEEEFNTPIEQLNKPNSTLVTAVRTKRIVVVESIEDELKRNPNERRYVSVNASDVGSLICYPILYGPQRDVHFVMCLRCDSDGYFKEAKERMYDDTLKRFARQIRLEYSLLLMQEALYG